MLQISLVKNAPLLSPAALCGLLLLAYAAYQRYFHPLARYPGPLLASLTNCVKCYYFWSLHIDEKILSLHEKYGAVVRIGPNELSVNDGQGALNVLKSGGRSTVKGQFYNGFTAFKPNLFGMQDEDVAHGFSVKSLAEMEPIFDRHISILRNKIDKFALTGEAFDLKDLLAFYVYDVLGSLAFSTDFNSQILCDPTQLPPINDHILLASLFGSLPGLLPYSIKCSRFLPVPWLQNLIRSRAQIRQRVTDCVRVAIESKGPKTLLTQLIAAKDPETGETLAEEDVSAEAFGFLVAGSHTTSASLTLLFCHLLNHPTIYQRLLDELQCELEDLEEGTYCYLGLEQKLPFTVACIRESFRHTPVFTMPLVRTVIRPEGLEIEGNLIPPGTDCSVTNHAVHHNPAIWGADHGQFNPDRWLDPEYTKDKINYLMPFGAGHRACIGRNVAMINIMKCITMIGRHFILSPVQPDEPVVTVTTGIGEKKEPFMCTVRRR